MLVAEHPSNILAYPRAGYAKTPVRAATLRQKWTITLVFSPSHSLQTLGQAVPGPDLITPGA